ncbi:MULTISPECIES: CusA/CzcA family heavy metal efflux RND transporter [unclassified Beijerinckia]|uniref:efflux RND transporter permease subunit n=1 Tax=unclassified Beijerinckia TaxID=2638183 RepID=UPI0008955E5A|nr:MULTISPECIES: CusA/CzcA family heavy metal efflux RND transporter [unclassified Beijerinckia]MDH7799532.1 cobalt-zinc-cadmium resistance protein CzcA [Beijerinckia sp. GAS462]SEB46079.1 cobalt-zinc-cadmium resistance protein CzcA [Beijerinckia sp. 28-YEA-48]
MHTILESVLRLRTLIIALFVMLLVVGGVTFSRLNIEAYPDPVPPLVQVITQNPGQSAEDIERYITIPIEAGLTTAQHLTSIRSISLFGLSDIRLQFTYDFTYDEALQRVLNLLGQLPPLQNGAQPGISPWSPIGEIYRYQLVGPASYSVMDLRTLQDWVVARRFRAIPGVLDVSSWGGKTKTFEAQIDLNKLTAHGLTLADVVETLKKSNVNVGGQTMNVGMQSAVVRGVGLIQTIDDIRNTMLSQSGANPVRIQDIADVQVSHLPRLGIAGRDSVDDIVQGTVLMRRGEQSTPVIARVKEEVEKINSSDLLPPGVQIARIYDRSELIGITTHTVMFNVLFGIALVFLVQWLFLGDLRSAIVVASAIPFAFFFAIIIMVLRGESANLLSIGAIDFGLIIDATVIMVENIFRHLSMTGSQHRNAGATDGPRAGTKLSIIYSAAMEVSRPILFSAAIILAGFLPLFTLSGVEGHIFGPMAKTYAYALAGGLLATFTVAPALSAFLLSDKTTHEDTFFVRLLRGAYLPLLRSALRNKILTMVFALVMGALSIIGGRSLGLEFLPTLEEGNLWLRATMPSSISLEAGNESANRIRRYLSELPEIETVVSQQGRTDDGTDSNGFFNVEFNVPLAAKAKWRPGMDKPALIKEISETLNAQFPGIEFNFSQYLQDNVAEAISGVKGDNTVKVYGHDLNTLKEVAEKIKAVMNTVPGIADLSVYTLLGQPTVKIEIDRFAAGRYGLAPGDINTAIQTAVGGEEAGNLYEPTSDRFFPIMVRLAPEYRKNIEALNQLTIGVKNDDTDQIMHVPLQAVAKVSLVSGPSFIYREQQQRYIPIKFSVRDRDLGSAIHEAQQKIAELKLPAGYRLEWAGQFGNLQDAIKRLQIIIPMTIMLIAVLLFVNFSSLTDTLLGLSVIPMAMVGGILALLVTGIPFSVSAAVGFIALFGISVMEGIILLSQFNQLMSRGVERSVAVYEACEVRFRPVMMTCMAAGVGLLPTAFSTAIGAQVQRPLAIVIVGGIMIAPLFILIVFPVLIERFSRRTASVEEMEGLAAPAE